MKNSVNALIVVTLIALLSMMLLQVVRHHKPSIPKEEYYYLSFRSFDEPGVELQEVWIMKDTVKVVLLDQIMMPWSYILETKYIFEGSKFETPLEASEEYYYKIND